MCTVSHTLTWELATFFPELTADVCMAKSLEDQRSRAPRSCVCQQCDEVWVACPLHSSSRRVFKPSGWLGINMIFRSNVSDLISTLSEKHVPLFHLKVHRCYHSRRSRIQQSWWTGFSFGTAHMSMSQWFERFHILRWISPGFHQVTNGPQRLMPFRHWSDTFKQPCVCFISTTTRSPNCATETVEDPRSRVPCGWTICHFEKGKGEDAEHWIGPGRALTFWLVGINGF